jgi:1,4-dihydroxy-2-naphthoate octaprenyltransferase
MIFLTAISIYTKLHQEIDLYHHHKAVTFQNTAAVLGERNSQILMFINLIIGVLAGTISFLFINLLPHWSFFVMMGFVLLLMVPTVLKFRRQKEDIAFRNALQRAFEQAAALALLLQYILPWLNQFINHTAI